MISNYMEMLGDLKKEYNMKLGKVQAIEANINGLQTEVDTARVQQDKNSKISALLQKAAEVSRGNTKAHLENVCTAALRHVFGKDLEFVIDIDECRGRPEAEFFIQYTDGVDTIKVKPEDATGGGVVDVLSTALRFAFLELLKEPRIQGPILLDEPGKMISEIAANRMAALLQELQRTFNRQTIMVSHNDAYGAVADKEFTVMMTGVTSRLLTVSQTNITNVAMEDPDEEQVSDLY